MAETSFRWSNTPEFAKVTELLNVAVRAKDHAEAKKSWEEAINIIAAEVPLYPIVHRKLPSAWDDSSLEGYQPLATTGLSFLGSGPQIKALFNVGLLSNQQPFFFPF